MGVSRRWRVAGAAIGLIVAAALIIPRVMTRAPAASPASAPASQPFTSDGITFVLPGNWVVTKSDIPLHYEHVLAYIGTGSGTMTCGTDFIPGLGGTCSETITLAPNSMVIRVSRWDGPPRTTTAVGDVIAANPKASKATVSGQPAAVQDIDTAYGADRVIEWTLSWPGVQYGSFVLTAYIKGPDQQPLTSQLDALIDSVKLTSAANP